MDFFKGIGDFFRGVFGGGNDDEEKKRRQREAQQRQQQRQTQSRPPTQVNQLFGNKPQNLLNTNKNPNLDPFKLPNQNQNPASKPVLLADKPQGQTNKPAQNKPKPTLDYSQLVKKAQGYKDAGVQDVNNYYGNDYKVLQDEIKKGVNADTKRIQGIMQSLDNRRKELKEFHGQRAENQSFKSARALEKSIQATRGDWSKEREALSKFWNSVGANEKNDFVQYLAERNNTPAQQYQLNLRQNGLTLNGQQAPLQRTPGAWRNGTGLGQARDFTSDKDKIEQIKARQQIADMAMKKEIKDVPLDQLGNKSFQQYLDDYNKADAFKQRDVMKQLEKTLSDNEKDYTSDQDLLRKTQQTMVLYQLLLDRGTKKENFGTKAQDFGEGTGNFIGGLLESPGKVVQSADVLRREAFMGGKDRGQELTEDWQAGKLTNEEYNKEMNDYARSLEWVKGDGSLSERILKSAGITADTVATFLPVGSAVKGGKAANLLRKGTQEGAEQLTKDSLKKIMLKEAGVNAGWSGAGALREGEIDPDKIVGEAALGAAVGAGAPVVGNQATKLWNRLRNGRTALPEAVEDVGRVTNQVERETAEDVLEGGVADELRAIINDPKAPPFQKKRAQEILDTQKRDPEAPEIPQSGIDRPAYLVKRDTQNTITREEENLNRYLQENPDLTPQQIEAARQAAQDRVVKLTDELKASRLANEDELGDLVTQTDENITQQRQVNEEVADQQAASGSPNPGDPVTPEGGSPEVEANNAYASQYENTFDMTDEILRQAEVDTTKGATKESGLKKFFHNASNLGADYWWKGNVDKMRDAFTSRAYNTAQGGNVFSQAPGRLATLFGNNAVLKDSVRSVLRVRNDMQAAAGDAVKRLHDNISDKVARLNMPPEQFNQLLDQVFETPEFLARKYGDNVANVAVDQLPAEVREVVDQLIEANKLRNLALFRQGKISQGEYQMFANGMHSPRLYDFEKAGLGAKGNKLIDTSSTMKRNKLEDISDETFDKLIESPAQRMLIRLEMAMRSNASNDALKALDEGGMLLNRAPNNQFSKLEGARWGNYQGKYVYNPIKGQLEDSIVMNTKGGEAFNDLLDQYRDSVFGKTDRFFKKTKTVYSPGTFIGNVASNPLLFNTGAGVNPLGQSARMAKAGADLVAHRTGRAFNPDIYEAQKFGVFASDTGKQITGENNPQLSVANNKRTNPFEAAYGGADDAAKLAIWRGLRARGVSPELAARRVSQFTQDYNNAGRLVRSLADMPVVGKPFARFAPELVRLVKNNVLYNPVGMVAGAGMIALIQDELSSNAGETPEEREARETAMGQTLIPGTGWLNKLLTGTDRDISLNFPVGDSAINIARAVGLNFPQDESGDPNISLIKSITPWAIPTRENAQGETVIAPEELFTSMTFAPIAQQVANRDFMQRQITDPENKTYFEDGENSVRKYEGEPAQEDQVTNRLKHLFQSYVPLANEGGAVAAALAGEKDYYGKERTLPEAVARMFGFKTESNDQEAQEKRIETKNYFDEDLKAVQDFVTENPDLAESYFKYRNPTRTRPTSPDDPGTKVSDLVTPERWDIINSDTSGRLFNFLKEQAIKQTKEDGKPLDPIFRVPPEQAKYLTELRSRPSGDDIEAQDILRATSPWYKTYEDAYFKYLDDNSKYFKNLPEYEGAAKENPRVEAYGEASKPVEQPPILKEYFKLKGESEEQAKAMYSANKDAISAAFDKYAVDKLNRINRLREIEGYEPIPLEVYKNDTFGFDEDGGSGYSSYGRGYGRGGSRSGGSDANLLGELTNFSAGIKAPTEAEAQAMPNTVALFQKLMAQRSGGRSKPQLGASSRGQ